MLQVDDEQKLVMAHAGITPQWDIDTAKMCAREVEAVLSSDSYPLFLDAMYGDMPNLEQRRACVSAPMRSRACATASPTASST